MDFDALVQDKKDGRCKITVPKRFKELEQPTHFRLDTKAPGSVETEVGSSGSGVDGAAKFIVGAWLHFRNPSVALTCCFAVSLATCTHYWYPLYHRFGQLGIVRVLEKTPRRIGWTAGGRDRPAAIKSKIKFEA